MKLDFSYSSEGDGLTFLVASVQERLIFENREFVDPRTASLGVKSSKRNRELENSASLRGITVVWSE